MRGRKRVVLVLVVAGIAIAGQRLGWFPASARTTEAGASAIDDAFRDRRSGVWVEGEGAVARLLGDDTAGEPHQQWLLRLPGGLTLKFAHNIDLAPRVGTLREGDRIHFRGRYEYNAKGGIIHWTHHDPGNRQPGGWIEHRGKRYE